MHLDHPPQRILLVVMRRLGDVLLSTALVRSVRRAWPDAQLEVLVNAGSASVLEGNPDIDRLWVQPERASRTQSWALVKQLWRRYDLAISALYNDRPHVWAFIAAPVRAGVVPPEGHPGARWKRWLTRAWCQLDLDHLHAVEQYLRVADAMGIPRVPEVVPPRPAVAVADAPAAPRPYAVVHPSPLYRYKAWTLDGWRALVAHLLAGGHDVRLTGGPSDGERALLQQIVDGLDPTQRARVQNLGGALPFAQLTPLIDGAEVFVGPDTSVTHLASATGTPTIALFGPSHPVAWGPWPAKWRGGSGDDAASPWRLKAPLQRRGNVWLVQGEGDCVPCLGEGCDKHPDSHSRCLDELPAARVIDVVDQALAESRRTAPTGRVSAARAGT